MSGYITFGRSNFSPVKRTPSRSPTSNRPGPVASSAGRGTGSLRQCMYRRIGRGEDGLTLCRLRLPTAALVIAADFAASIHSLDHIPLPSG